MEVAGKKPDGDGVNRGLGWCTEYVLTDVLSEAYQGQKVRGDAMDAPKGGPPKEAAANCAESNKAGALEGLHRLPLWRDSRGRGVELSFRNSATSATTKLDELRSV